MRQNIITHCDNFITNYEKNPLNAMTKVITNCSTFITNYDRKLSQITAKEYYKLHQKSITNYGSSNFSKLLMTIINYISFQYYYRLRQKLLQLLGRYYKLQRYYKLHRNNYDHSHFMRYDSRTFSRNKAF